MADFCDRLRDEMEYAGLVRKELAAKAGIKKRALDAYLGVQRSMPPADVAVKLAAVFGVTVEYLVNGTLYNQQNTLLQAMCDDTVKYRKLRNVLDALLTLPDDSLTMVTAMIKAAAQSTGNG